MSKDVPQLLGGEDAPFVAYKSKAALADRDIPLELRSEERLSIHPLEQLLEEPLSEVDHSSTASAPTTAMMTMTHVQNGRGSGLRFPVGRCIGAVGQVSWKSSMLTLHITV